MLERAVLYVNTRASILAELDQVLVGNIICIRLAICTQMRHHLHLLVIVCLGMYQGLLVQEVLEVAVVEVERWRVITIARSGVERVKVKEHLMAVQVH